MEENCLLNSKNIITVNKVIYNVDDIDIDFGCNNYLNNSQLNDSTSQIHFNSTNETSYKIKTITIKKIIENYNIKYHDISLIKVDIEGGEEFILEDYKCHPVIKAEMVAWTASYPNIRMN